MEDKFIFQPIPLTDMEIEIFHEATFYLYGSYFEPIALAKRTVNDSQYKYIAISRPKYSDEPYHFIIIDIYMPIKGRPYVTKTLFLDINKL